MNCWEFKKCGREQGCRAYPDNGDDCAWVAGTDCGGRMQGITGIKLANCIQCDFYNSPFYLSKERRIVSRTS